MSYCINDSRGVVMGDIFLHVVLFEGRQNDFFSAYDSPCRCCHCFQRTKLYQNAVL